MKNIKLFYDTKEKSSYILYKDKFYIIRNKKVIQEYENVVMSNMISNEIIYEKCDFYDFYYFINFIYKLEEISINDINLFLLNREFIINNEYHRIKQIKKIGFNNYEYIFITPTTLQYVIDIEF